MLINQNSPDARDRACIGAWLTELVIAGALDVTRANLVGDYIDAALSMKPRARAVKRLGDVIEYLDLIERKYLP